MTKAFSFPGMFSSNSTRASYQFNKYILDNYETTLVVNMAMEDEFSDIKEEAENLHIFDHTPLLYPLYIIFILIKYYIKGERFEYIVSGQNLFSALAAIGIGLPTRHKWVVLGSDIPEGRINVINTYTPWSILKTPYVHVDFLISKLAYRLADLTILSDESLVVDTDKDSIIVVPGGVDCGLIEKKSNIFNNTNSSEVIEFVYVGHMHYHRGIDIILKAARNLPYEARFTLIGNGPETAPPQDKKMLRKSLGMSFDEAIEFNNSNVTCEYLGRIDHEEVILRLLSSDVGICLLPYERDLPHFNKAYPLKTFEYMSCSLAVISSRTEAAEDVLKDDRQLVENTVEEVHEKMVEFASDEDLVNNLGSQNKTRSETYCWREVRQAIHMKFKDAFR